MIAIFLPFLLAGAAIPASDAAALDARVTEIFRPYALDQDDQAPWDRPLFSAEVAGLIAEWQRVVPDDEPDELNDGDWFCQCQDWDAKAFKVVRSAPQPVAGGGTAVEVKITLFADAYEPRPARLLFRKEAGQWKLDDILAPDAFPKGLKQALRDTIAADKVRAAEKNK